MCSKATRMRFKKGSKVEVFGRKEVPSGSWYSAEIIHGNGHYYTIKYDVQNGVISADLFERVARKAIRPCPPALQMMEDWVSGDVVEVFHGFSWKMATVLRVLLKNGLLVRLVGSLQELEVGKNEIRPRFCWQDDEWKLIGKGSSYCEERVTLKLRCNYNSQQMETTASTFIKNSSFPFSNINSNASQSKKRKQSQKIRANGKDKRLSQLNPTSEGDSIASSVASCSKSGKNICRFDELFGIDSEYNSDAESSCGMRSEKGNSALPADEKLTDEIHRIELHAYRSTIEALHKSGPLSWEQETLLTNLRDSLHITNDEHLMELRNLNLLPEICGNNRVFF